MAEPPKLPFANDGSFFEMFQKMQQEKQQQQQQEQAASASGQQGGSKEPSPAPGAATSAADADAGPSTSAQAANGGADFIASSTFEGAKPGYVFKTDKEGTGYYRDYALADRVRQAAEARARPVVLKSNNPIIKNLGKRPGVLDLPSGVAKKAAKPGEQDQPTYLREMERYKSISCASDTKHDRPLVK